LSEDGWVYVVDRLKELIKVKGLQVPPAELEDLLLSNPDIHDCAVIGIPDESSGEIPKAYVVKRNPKLTEKQVMDFVKGVFFSSNFWFLCKLEIVERVANYKQLKGGVEFIQEIPKSAAGKILRRFLRDQNKQGQGQSQINAKLWICCKLEREK
jgi:4-coumarate--CoA ligase